MLGQATAPRAWLALGGAYVGWTLFSVGALLDGRRWVVPVEAARVLAGAAVAVLLLAGRTVLARGW